MSITITYGSYTIPFIIEKFRENLSYRNYSLDVDFLITGATDSAFKSALATAEDALTKDSQKLEIKFGTEIHRSFDPANYSGLMTRGTLSKNGSPEDTDRSRRYSWHCEIQLPADDLTQDNYRREASWSITYGENRRPEINFQGVYTAGGGNTAKQNYDANVGAWISSIFTALSFTEANFELVNEQINADNDENATINFNRLYREIIFNDTSAELNNPAIKQATVSFARTWDTEAGLSNAGGVRVSVQYSCFVDKDDPTYGSYTALAGLWKNVIRPHLITQSKTIWGGNLSVMESENTTIDPTQRQIQSSLQILVSGRGNLLSYTESIEITEEKQWQYRKILDGQDDTYTFWSPGRKISATQSIEEERLYGLPQSTRLLDSNEKGLAALVLITSKNGEWNLDSQSIRYTPVKKGISPDGGLSSINIFKSLIQRRYTWIASNSQGNPLKILFGGRISTVERNK